MQKVFPDDFLDIGASFTSEGRELSDFQKKSILLADYISQTPFEIYETTNGRNSPVSASNHFLTHRRGRSPIKSKGAWVYPQGPGTYVSWSRDALVAFFLVLQTIR